MRSSGWTGCTIAKLGLVALGVSIFAYAARVSTAAPRGGNETATPIGGKVKVTDDGSHVGRPSGQVGDHAAAHSPATKGHAEFTEDVENPTPPAAIIHAQSAAGETQTTVLGAVCDVCPPEAGCELVVPANGTASLMGDTVGCVSDPFWACVTEPTTPDQFHSVVFPCNGTLTFTSSTLDDCVNHILGINAEASPGLCNASLDCAEPGALVQTLSIDGAMGDTIYVRVAAEVGGELTTYNLSGTSECAVCGNGVLEFGEVCETGAGNDAPCPGECIFSSCQCPCPKSNTNGGCVGTLTQSYNKNPLSGRCNIGNQPCTIGGAPCAPGTGACSNSTVACSANPNGWARCMDRIDENWVGGSTVTEVRFGVGSYTAGAPAQEVCAVLYAIDDCANVTTSMPGDANVTFLCRECTMVVPADNDTIKTILLPNAPIVPAGSDLVVEIENLDTTAQVFRPMSNGFGQCDLSYIRSAPCGIDPWTPTGAIGFAAQNLVLNADVVCGGVPAVCGDGILNGCEECDTALPPPMGQQCVGCVLQPAPPANDDCVDRITVTDGCTAFSNVSATDDGASCTAVTGNAGMHSDVWYNYVATCTGTLTVDLCPTNGCLPATSISFDTAISVQDGTTCGFGGQFNCCYNHSPGTGCDSDPLNPNVDPCQACVCAADPTCCGAMGGVWDQFCANIAATTCQRALRCLNGPTPGATCTTNANCGTGGTCVEACHFCGETGGPIVECADDSCGGPGGEPSQAVLSVTMNENLKIQIGSFSAGAATQGSGSFKITCAPTIPAPEGTGACGNDSSLTCSDTTAAGCHGRFAGAGTSCATHQFEPVLGGGACCLPNGSCITTIQFDCEIQSSGHFHGTGTTCGAGGVLCNVDGDCDFNNGAADLTGGVHSQYSTVPTYYAEAADNFIFYGSNPGDCRLHDLDFTVLHSPNVGTPADYDGINVVIYNDGFDPGNPNDTKVYKAVCSTAGGAIPDANAAGVECVIEVSDAGTATIADLDIDALIQHTWQGDLSVTLSHDTDGPGGADPLSIQILNRPGVAACGAFGYSADDYGDTSDMNPKLILDDEAAVSIDSYNGCTADPGNPGVGFLGIDGYAGPAEPTQSLSAFDGRTKNGTWKITVVDAAAPDTGSVLNWSLHFNNSPLVPKGPLGIPQADGSHVPLPGNPASVIKNVIQLGPASGGQWTWNSLGGGYYAVSVNLDSVGNVDVAKNKKNWLAIAPVVPESTGYQTAWAKTANSDNNDAQAIFVQCGTPEWGVAYGGDLAFTVTGSKPFTPCLVKADCADLNDNGLRDNPCVRWICNAGACSQDPGSGVYGDIGGPAGPTRCDLDASPDNNDAFHALNCFANSNFGLPGNYPCDDSNLPMNADIGGSALTCCPDGACDNNDRFLALTAFAAGGGPVGPNMCACPGNSPPGTVNCPANATAPYAPRFTDQATLIAVPSTRTAKVGDLVSVDVFMANAVNGLQGYQLHLGVSGGRHGSLELVNINIADREDFVYSGLPVVDAYNVKTHQMLADHDEGAVATKANAYLGTFTYRVSPDASGTFVIDVLGHAAGKPENRTFLFGPINQGMVELVGTKPAVVVVTSGRAQGVR